VTELYQEDMFNRQNALTDSLTGGHLISLSFSMGISRLSKQIDSALHEMDRMMYEDKQRNRK